MKNKHKFDPPVKNTPVMNHGIRAELVRLVRDNGSKVIAKSNAIKQAKEQGMDLVVVQMDKVPIVKICDWGKENYQKSKKQKEKAKLQRMNQQKIKEVQFRPVTDRGDLITISKKIMGWVKSDPSVKVKLVIKYRSRETDRQDTVALDMLMSLLPTATYETQPSMNGRNMIAVIKFETNENENGDKNE